MNVIEYGVYFPDVGGFILAFIAAFFYGVPIILPHIIIKQFVGLFAIHHQVFGYSIWFICKGAYSGPRKLDSGMW